MKISLSPRVSAITLGLLVTALGLTACADLSVEDSAAPPVVPGAVAAQAKPSVGSELIIGFKAGASSAEKARARGNASAASKEAIDSFGGGDLELATIPPGLALHAAIAALKDDPAVDFAEPNYTVQHMGFPTEVTGGQAQFDDQLWGLNNVGQTINPDNVGTPDGQLSRTFSGTPDVDMDLNETWAQIAGTPKTEVYVGIIDEGIDFNHQDLKDVVGLPEKDMTGCYTTDRKGKQTPAACCADGKDNDHSGKADDCYGWDFANNDKTVYDGGTLDHHGTHVSGTIAGRPNSNGGVRGVSSNVKLISGKFLGATGGTTAAAVNSVNYFNAVKAGGYNVVATNNSWGGGGFSEALYNAIKQAGVQGILFVAAAGNEETDNDATPSFPCNYGRDYQAPSYFSKGKVYPGKFFAGLTNIICVAAHNQNAQVGRINKVADDVCGTTCQQEKALYPTWFSNWGELSVDVSAPGSNVLSTTPANTYAYYRGTSMATPHVTGLVALLAGEGIPTSQIKARITTTTIATEVIAGRKTRNGRVNAARALANSSAIDP